MMTYTSSIVLFALLPAAVSSKKFAADVSAPPVTFATCPMAPKIETSLMYHDDALCDRDGFNKFKESLNRHWRYKSLMSSGTSVNVPNQKTVLCPENVHDLRGDSQVTGFDTVWIVENSASTPVVVAYTKEDGLEYSAINPDVTPPQADPDAIMAPGQWKSVNTFEGHIFHVREYDPKTNKVGRVLLQHRVGLIPVGQNFDQMELNCSALDIEPLTEEMERDPNFVRTSPRQNKLCNFMDIGFRNMARCPLHGYYLSPLAEPTGSCPVQEKFKFHLGRHTESLADNDVADFMWDWRSPTKFESTYMGHSFAFRFAENPEILVDQVTLEPTKVGDCPCLKEKTGTAQAQRDAILLPRGQIDMESTNATQAGAGNLTAWGNSTSSSSSPRRYWNSERPLGPSPARFVAFGGIDSF